MIFQNEINHVLVLIQTHSEPLLKHGSITLFFLLALGIIALPIPDETLLVTAGFLIAKGKLMLFPTSIAAYLGSMTGISCSYLIGYTGGSFIITKYGHWIGLNEVRLARTRLWFNRMGMWALFIGYFIPGVRHFTGYLVGSVRIRYWHFARFAYSGAIVWATTFMTIGYLLGNL